MIVLVSLVRIVASPGIDLELRFTVSIILVFFAFLAGLHGGVSSIVHLGNLLTRYNSVRFKLILRCFCLLLCCLLYHSITVMLTGYHIQHFPKSNLFDQSSYIDAAIHWHFHINLKYNRHCLIDSIQKVKAANVQFAHNPTSTIPLNLQNDRN